MIFELDTKKSLQEHLNENPKLVLNFFATWCGPCQMLGAMLKDNFADDKEVKVLRVDIDKFRELAIQYGVRGVPTMFKVENGTITDRQVGFLDEQAFRNWVK